MLDLRNFINIYMPVIVLAGLFIAECCFVEYFKSVSHTEFGVVESAQAVLMFLLACYIFKILVVDLLIRRQPVDTIYKTWFCIGLLGALYVFLEEISYGQHYLNWETPQKWAAINDQAETNVHNTSSWLDQKPRLLLEIGIILGGIIYPILLKFSSNITNKLPLRKVLPNPELFIVAVLAILPRLYERIGAKMMGYEEIFVRTSEIQELYFYYFLLLYFIYLKQRAFKVSA